MSGVQILELNCTEVQLDDPEATASNAATITKKQAKTKALRFEGLLHLRTYCRLEGDGASARRAGVATALVPSSVVASGAFLTVAHKVAGRVVREIKEVVCRLAKL